MTESTVVMKYVGSKRCIDGSKLNVRIITADHHPMAHEKPRKVTISVPAIRNATYYADPIKEVSMKKNPSPKVKRKIMILPNRRINREDIIRLNRSDLGSLDKPVILVEQKSCTDKMEIKRDSTAESRFAQGNLSQPVLSLCKKSSVVNIKVKNIDINREDSIRLNRSDLESLDKPVILVEQKSCTDKMEIKRDSTAESRFAQGNLSQPVLSLCKKSSVVNNKVNNIDDTVEYCSAQGNLSQPETSLFKSCIVNNEINKTDNPAKSCSQGNRSQTVMLLVKKSCLENIKINTPGNKFKFMVASKDKICVNNTDYDKSPANSPSQNSIKKNVSEKNYHQEKSLKLYPWSGATEKHSDIKAFDKVPNMTVYDKVCRICLQQGNVPIFREKQNLAEAVMTVGGITISEVDKYPKYLCIFCCVRLQNALMFRNNAQMSDMKLRAMEADEGPGNIDEKIFEADGCSDKKPVVFEECLPHDSESINHNIIKIIKMPKKELEPEPLLQSIETEFKSANNIHEDTDEDSTDVDDYFNKAMYQPEVIRKPTYLPCQYCDAHFFGYQKYVDHTRESHPEIRQLQCTLCHKYFGLGSLEKHMIHHDGFVCHVCGKHINDITNFFNHLRIHSTELPFKCDRCPYRGRTKSHLKSHTISHTGEKRYKCPQCPQRFGNTCNLIRHVRGHVGERPFKCKTCNQSFYVNYDLKRHTLNVHHGLRYICNICREVLGTKKRYVEHRREVHNIQKLPNYGTPNYIMYDMIKQ